MVDRFILDFTKSELQSASYSCKPSSLAKIPKPAIVKKELASLDQGRLSVLTVGAFKVPSLRNVELTGPYMHNGSMKSLDEVVEFYNRGGNYHNRRHPDTLIFNQSLGPASKKALVAFLKTLTDERVRWEKAPFDHPAINVPHGHTNTASFGLADDQYLMIPAIGASGRTAQQGPLLAFESYLQ